MVQIDLQLRKSSKKVDLNLWKQMTIQNPNSPSFKYPVHNKNCMIVKYLTAGNASHSTSKFLCKIIKSLCRPRLHM